MLTSRPSHALRTLTLMTAAALVLCAPVVVMAQGSTPAPTTARSTTVTKKNTKDSAAEAQNRLHEHLTKLTKRLKLTDDQVAKVKAIMQSKSTEMGELRAKYQEQPASPENQAAMEKARKELHADIEVKLAQVLTADQMTEYKKMRAEHMKHEGAREEKEEQTKGTDK